MHDPDNVHDCKIRSSIDFIVEFIVWIVIGQQEHQAGWQQDEYKVECKPSNVVSVIGQKIYNLLVHV